VYAKVVLGNQEEALIGYAQVNRQAHSGIDLSSSVVTRID
jgi:hypothetical protein